MSDSVRHKLRESFQRASAAHVVIDMQRFYCSPLLLLKRTNDPGLIQAVSRLVTDIAQFTARTRDELPPLWVVHSNRYTRCTGPGVTDFFARARAALPLPGRVPAPVPSAADQDRRELYCMPVRASDPVIGKRATDAFEGTALDATLRARGVDTLVLSGVFADQCVRDTALGAVKRGYDVVLARDLTIAGIDEAFFYEDVLEAAGVTLAPKAVIASAAAMRLRA